jgi:hypothetical protein
MREDGKIDYVEFPADDLAATKGFYARPSAGPSPTTAPSTPP